MLNQTLKEAFIAQAEKPETINEVAAQVYRGVSPETLAFYHQTTTAKLGVSELLQRRYLRGETDFELEKLAECAPGTLGHAYYHLVKDNGLKPDVADHPLLQLSYQNSDAYYLTYRILETQDIWRLVAGYGLDTYSEWGLSAFVAAQTFSLESVLWLSILLTRISFVVPEASFAVMDAIAGGWQRGKAAAPMLPVIWEELWDKSLDELRQQFNLATPVLRQENLIGEAANWLQMEQKLPEELKELFWIEVENVTEQGNIIERVARYVAAFDDELKQRYANTIASHDGLVEAYKEGYLRPPLEIQDLRDCPAGTLGYSYYHQIVDNGLEVEIININKVPPTSGGLPEYVGRRILQTHDLWHCLTEYTTNGVDEVALQAFQLAQLGSPFSSNLLGTLLTRATLLNPQIAPYLMQAIAQGWQHGRETPPLLPVKWEHYWNTPIEEVRRQHNIYTHTGDLLATV